MEFLLVLTMNTFGHLPVVVPNHPNKPAFVGDDYICSAHQYLWRDQQQCGSNSSWFFKMMPLTTADINVRVCRDQASVGESIALTELELYIQ